MSSTQIILISGKGILSNAIIDIMPGNFEIQRIYLSSEDVKKTLIHEQSLLSNADIIILNLSEMIVDSEIIISQLKSTTTAPIIVLHLYQQKTFMDAFLKMGASAYLPVNFNPSTLLSTISQLLKKTSPTQVFKTPSQHP